MKKIVAIIVTLMMILAMSCAFAFDWSNVTVQSAGCDKYNVVLYKLERVEGINGDFFRIAPLRLVIPYTLAAMLWARTLCRRLPMRF